MYNCLTLTEYTMKIRKTIFTLLIVFFFIQALSANSSAEYFNRTASRPEYKAEQVTTALKIQPGNNIADIGAGGGYFSFLFAKETGRKGKVYAVDIDPGHVKYIQEKAEKEKISNVISVQAKSNDSRLAENDIDLIFMRNVYHHLPSPTSDYLIHLKKKLKANGRIAVVEFRPGYPYESSSHNTDPQKIKKDFQRAGFVLVEEHQFIKSQSFLIFRMKNQ